ncbi:MAG: hypothetical protein CL897_00410 [Dehalococcoidia bacterium]|nr:hypothetical protein [Dehalococcoidia bacterium]|tara:strand:- start:4345 stop:4893 length:549 start_codon:yes stop_codon:yes gene_type:complete
MPENERIPAGPIVEAIKTAFRSQRTKPPTSKEPLGWVLSVPDTHQRSVITELEGDSELRLLTCSTEDEANAIAAGLHIGGQEVALIIQHAGLYASVNTLRGVGLDGRVPLFMLVGLLSREPDLAPRNSPRSMVRFAEPLMETFQVPYALLETREDLALIPEYYALSREQSGPTVVFVGRETT